LHQHALVRGVSRWDVPNGRCSPKKNLPRPAWRPSARLRPRHDGCSRSHRADRKFVARTNHAARNLTKADASTFRLKNRHWPVRRAAVSREGPGPSGSALQLRPKVLGTSAPARVFVAQLGRASAISSRMLHRSRPRSCESASASWLGRPISGQALGALPMAHRIIAGEPDGGPDQSSPGPGRACRCATIKPGLSALHQ